MPNQNAFRVKIALPILLLISVLFCVEFVKGALLIAILPVFMKSVLGLSAFSIGLSLALQYVGDNAFRSPAGWLMDRIGYRSAMLMGLLVAIGAIMMAAKSGGAWWMAAACALLGIGTSPLWPCVISLATETAGERARGTVMSFIYAAWFSGAGLGPIVINLVAGKTFAASFRLLFALMAAATLAVLFLPGAWRLPAGKKRRHPLAPGFPSPLSLQAALRSRIGGFWRAAGEIRRSLSFNPWFYPAMFANNLTLGLLIPVVTIYARNILHLTPQQYSFLLFSGGAVAVIMLFPVGRWVDKRGSKWFLHLGFSLTAAALFVFSFVKAVPQVLIVAVLLGAGYAMVIPAWKALIAHAVPAKGRGSVWGVILTIEGGGMICGTIISGKLWDLFGYHAPFITGAAVMAALFAVHLLVLSRPRQAQ
ncbi:MAG TPA: MFS transporter [Bacilli bacterium]